MQPAAVLIFVSTHTSHCPDIKIKKFHELATFSLPKSTKPAWCLEKKHHQQNLEEIKVYTKQPLTTDMDEKGGSGSPLIPTILDLVENG